MASRISGSTGSFVVRLRAPASPTLGLVDSVEVAVIPVLLGDGLPVLPPPSDRAKLKLVKHHVYRKTGTIALGYTPGLSR